MQTYPVRPTHRKQLDLASISAVARKHFGSVETGPTEVVATYGALERLTVRISGRDLAVEVRMNPKVDNTVAAETVARYNRFLEETTGYTAKERARKLRKSASE